MYKIEIDPATQFVEVTLEGHWTMETMRSFERDVAEALRLRGLSARDCQCLSLSEGYSVPSQDVADRLVKAFAWKRLAIVTGSQLMRLQIGRLFDGQMTRVFSAASDARRWLTSSA